jgi:histidyl-tRNA synthetase
MEGMYAMKAVTKLRKAGISAELYPDIAKNQKHLGKQMNYVNNRGIQFAVLAGEDEVKLNRYTLKDLKNGKQLSFDFEGLLAFLS